MAAFLSMGGYGGFVWPAYALGLIVLAGLLVASLRSLRMAERDVAALEESSPRRRARRGGATGDEA